eukprot:1473554-Amphidinium_carterae.1
MRVGPGGFIFPRRLGNGVACFITASVFWCEAVSTCSCPFAPLLVSSVVTPAGHLRAGSHCRAELPVAWHPSR